MKERLKPVYHEGRMKWYYFNVSCSVLNSPERRLQILQSFGAFDQDVFELLPRPEVAQRDLLAVLFQRGGCLLRPPTRKEGVSDSTDNQVCMRHTP